ncbi:MAG: choice-of-anchor E domain-containing protein [Planctomycetes bacterium]|nr:choice-of-anchor E domain-containing protein [Planctomycetota bacterium]MCB9903394.1 choice-of-anchor E domain-containing protein [Planctomycetota bacterium]
MNIWKLAAGAAPAFVLFAASADAQLCTSGTNCPPVNTCPTVPDATTTLHTTVLGDPDYTDEFGPCQAPCFVGGGGLPQLSVKQFDQAAIEALYPPGSTVTLLNAQVRLSGDLEGDVAFNNRNLTTGCQVTWDFTVDVELGANGAIGTPALPLSLQVGGLAPLSIAASSTCPAQNLWEYQEMFTPVSAEACLCESDGADLAAWTGGGVITWDLSTQANDSDSSPCGAICKAYNNNTTVKVEVVYTYCVSTPDECIDCDPSGCDCDEPSPHYRKPGSLLLFPEFDNRDGDMTLITVTNADCDSLGDDVDVEFVFIDHEDCSEFNTTITLTPCDTFTAITNFVNPNMEQGYFYAFAKNSDGDPITHNGLIGSAMVISGIEVFDYQVNPIAFLGMTPDGTNTDLDGDEVRDLDGLEYDHSPDTITIPRFMGQGLDALGDGTPINSHLILIGLSGGQDFTTTLCFDVYNDNEEAFSGEYTFYCWEKPTLVEVRGTFRNSFLRTTDHDPNEILGAADRRESGWICIDACFADSQQETIVQPAFYAVLVERVGIFMAADLPFECGRQSNGALLPRGLFGDGDPNPVNGDNQ